MQSKRMSFLPRERILDVNRQFAKFGYWLIIFNRFLTGIRAIISLFAGVGRLFFWKTTIAAFVSALIWNALLLSLGTFLGSNWRKIGDYLQSWSVGVLALVGLTALVVLIVWLLRRKKNPTE